MDSFQEKFALAIKNIYLDVFYESIELEIKKYVKYFENKNILYKGKTFILLDSNLEWKITEEAFIWSKSVKLLTELEIVEVVFAVLELKGYTNLNFWLNFPFNDFSIDNKPLQRLDFTYEITKEMKSKYELDKVSIKPFKLEK